MTSHPPESVQLEQLRQHFNQAPYPRFPLEQSPKAQYEELFIHNLVTSYYLKYRTVINPSETLILDAGCGTGYRALVLAEANPGARVIGVDLSDESIRLAQERLKFHGFTNTEFHVLSIEELPQIGLQFDYINCDEVLYLVPDPLKALQAMKAVLKPQGLIRTNLHNVYQREDVYQAQALFKWLGTAEEPSEDAAYTQVVETMTALRDEVRLKQLSWEPENCENPLWGKEVVFANQLIKGDKGFTIPAMFELLAAADLEFVSMVNWRRWDVLDLFKNPDDLPVLWGMGLMGASVEERLRLYELLNPVHRLMDFWCTHPDQPSGIPLEEWTDRDWQTATVHLHPQLRTDGMKQDLIDCIAQSKDFEISRAVPLPSLAPVLINNRLAACLLPLWDGPQPIQTLVSRYGEIRPIHPVTLEPMTEAIAFDTVKTLLNQLEAFLYVLLTHP